MNINYSKKDDYVYVSKEDGKVIRRDNVDNIETILQLENELEKADERIEKEKKDQFKFKGYRTLIIAAGSMPTLSLIADTITGKLQTGTLILGGVLLATYSVALIPSTLIVKSFDKNVARLNLYKDAVNKEIKYQISRSNKIVSFNNQRGDFSLIRNAYKNTYDKYDLLHTAIMEDYKMNGEVIFPLFEDSERRIYSTMAKEELLNTQKNNRKIKVKVKEI